MTRFKLQIHDWGLLGYTIPPLDVNSEQCLNVVLNTCATDVIAAAADDVAPNYLTSSRPRLLLPVAAKSQSDLLSCLNSSHK